ncbi:hypothetical protein Q31b_22790 [Novipirellula aureliae]|uniref:DUF4064 domain-containing protein n=1 Tax=Novipirellula aureliae TaxID=2527966 RepID=A0A5C6E6H2_9BACT|nr:hypothetical protein [Novipirellula aureliae]TWU43241.1 hypothetical protein Q31b_22790 [Novipirellula aureliae]
METNQDAEQLNLLTIFHYVVAGMVGLFSLFPILHLVIGIGIVSGAFDVPDSGTPPPAFLGWFFILIPLAMMLIGLAFAIAIAITGRKLARRSGYMYCLVIAGIECMLMPFGTVLGVLTILVLMRPSVKTMFGVEART